MTFTRPYFGTASSMSKTFAVSTNGGGSISTLAPGCSLAAAVLAGPASMGGPGLRVRDTSLGGPAAPGVTRCYRQNGRATLVQFSTEFCAPCRPPRQILGQVGGMVDGVSHVEVDAAERLDLVRRLGINSTPTVLVLGPDGAVATRAVGVPRKADVIAALGSVTRPASSGTRAEAE